MSQILTQLQKQRMWDEIKKHSSYIQTLNEYEKSAMIEYCENLKLELVGLAYDFLLVNPNYEYPNDVSEDEKFDYWLSRTSSGEYFLAEKAIELLKGKTTNEIPTTKIEKESNTAQKKANTLKEIWQKDSKGTKDSYDKAIELLKKEYSEIGKSFVTEVNGELYWTKTNNFVQYLAGFVFSMMKKKWILDQYSAPDYKRVLSNTFHIEFKPDPFKSLSANPPNEKYLAPFKNFKTNI